MPSRELRKLADGMLMKENKGPFLRRSTELREFSKERSKKKRRSF